MRLKKSAIVLLSILVLMVYVLMQNTVLHQNNNLSGVAAVEKITSTEEKGGSTSKNGTTETAKGTLQETGQTRVTDTSTVPVKENTEKNQQANVKPAEDKTAAIQKTPAPQEEPVNPPRIAVPNAVDEKATEITGGKQVAMSDYAKVAGVILGKLSLSEIKFLFDTASDDFWVETPVEEIEKVRNIIFSKLTTSDIETLKELGKKYGKSMTILDPDIDVAKTKEKQVAKKQAQK